MEPSQVRGQGTLGVILASPPLTSGTRTLRNLEIATAVLGFRSYRVANLFPIPTQTINEISEKGTSGAIWEDARPDLRNVARSSTSILLAYGVSEPLGAAREEHRGQLDWLAQELKRAGHERVWQVGGQPRHPSRWHQFASDKYGRTSGGALADRLAELLVPTKFGSSRD